MYVPESFCWRTVFAVLSQGWIALTESEVTWFAVVLSGTNKSFWNYLENVYPTLLSEGIILDEQ